MSMRKSGIRSINGNAWGRKSILLACGAVCGATIFANGPIANAASSFTWTSSAGGNWSNGANWQGGTAPTVVPNGDVDLSFDAAGNYTSNNDLGPFYVYNTSFGSTNGTTTLTGGDLDLSWPLSENNNPTFTNNSTNPVIINNNVNFETPNGVGGTTEYFSLQPGSTTTINGNVGLQGGSSLYMVNGQPATSLGGAGGTLIWTQPVVFTNNPPNSTSSYFPFRIYEGTLEMGGYTIDNGGSDQPILNEDGVNVIQTSGGVNNGAVTDMYIGPEDRFKTYPYYSGDPLLHPNDAASFFLTGAGAEMNQPVQIGDAGTITIGGVNTSGTVYFNDFFKTLPSDGNGAYLDTGQSQTMYFSAAAGGTVVQNFALIRGGGSGYCAASVDKVGPGTWVVAGGGDSPTGAQAYQGNTTVRDGTLELAYDDTGTNYVTLPAEVTAPGDPNTTYYANGDDGGSLGYNAPTNAVQLGDSGTLPTDNIALLTLINSGAPTAARQVLHNIQVNDFNPSGTTSIGVADNGTGDFSGNILLARSVTLASGAGGIANFSGNITGTGAVSVSGTGTANLTGLNSYNGSTSVASGAKLVIGVAGALPSGSAIINNGTVAVDGNSVSGNVSGTGTLAIGPDTPATLVIGKNTGGSSQNALTIGANSTLDITNNHLIINYGSGSDPMSTIYTYLKSGYNNGKWNGTGIISSSAQTKTNSLSYGIGFSDGADEINGHPIVTGLSSGQIELKYTLLGDANLDGTVNGSDFSILAANFGQGYSNWDQGNFLYTPAVNGTDFSALAANFGQGDSGADTAVSAVDVAALDAFAAANGLPAPSFAVVPEPATAGLVCVAGLQLLSRRRRKSTRSS